MSFGDLLITLSKVTAQLDSVQKKATDVVNSGALQQLGVTVQDSLPPALDLMRTFSFHVISTGDVVKKTTQQITGDTETAAAAVARNLTASQRALESVSSDPRFGGYLNRVLTLITQLHSDEVLNNPRMAELLSHDIRIGKDILSSYTVEGRNIDWSAVEQAIIDAAAAAKRAKVLGKVPTSSTGAAGSAAKKVTNPTMDIITQILAGTL